MKSRKNIFLLISFLLFSIFVNAQNSNDRENIKKQTNLQALQRIINKSSAVTKTVNAKAANQKVPLTKTTKDGRLGVLFGFNEKGQPVYAYDDNVNAAISGRTDKIWQGGSTGLDLTGAGIEIAVWESGYARPTHQEFGGRASNGGDGGSVTSHGTHTGGTLIATGVDPAARGMASGATIKNYTATGMVSETAAFAAAGGILANNSNTPSGSSGDYNAVARDMDDVLYNAPFYLQCKSAGNDGNNYGIIRSTQLSKNLLVVGNTIDVSNYTGPSSVSMWTTSSYGPTNDWRIKPDVVNNGRSVYSSDSSNDTDYGTKTGTSMSTPATAGTIALLQQHYKNLNGVYMRAATAKALLIDTADEVGASDGPDFASGWGLINAERAAQVISNNGNTSIMDELTLNNGGTYTRTIISDGVTPLALTIAWNDPGGATGTGTSPRLINDLDVRVTGNGDTHSPWVMVPNASFNNYTDPAQKGDNFRDNVEKIDAVLTAGTYTVTVTHKGTLSSGSQDFSLIVNGVIISSDTQAPSDPTNLTASNTTINSTDLSWTASTDNVGVTAYEVFQGTTNIGTSTTTNFNVTGLAPSTSFNFSIKARDAAGNLSGSSNTVNVTTLTPVPDTQAPSVPAGLAASNITQTTLELSWTASTDNIGVTEYEIFQDGTSIGTSATTSFSVTGLTADTAYSFTVNAKDAAGNVSGNSNVANVTTVATPPCTGINSFPYSESFESGFGVWTNATGDDIEWTRDSGGTPSNNTGPSTGQDGAFYLYTEASTNVTPPGNPNKAALLNSPCIDLTGVPNGSLEFGYHMFGNNVGAMEVLVSTDDGANYTSIWLQNGNIGNVWNQATVSLTSYAGSVIQLQFKGTTGNGWSSDMAIDNINIISVTPDNEAPSVPTNLTASNIGDTTIDLSWTASIDNVGVTEYEVFQGGTSIGTSATTSFNVTGLTAETTYSFIVNAKDAAGNVSGNSNAANVTTTATPACAGINSFPYSESFESGVGVWTQETNDDLDWIVDSAGTPSNNTGPSAASDGTNYIYTEATGNGTGFPNKVALLTSPCIDLSSQPNAELNFDYHMFGAAMGTLEMRASTDDGATWTTIWSLTGDQGNSWNSQAVSLAAYSGNVIKLQIKGTTGSDFTSDITVDNLSIISLVPDTQAPTAPTNLTASNVTNTTVDLSWNASTDDRGVVGYDVYQDGVTIDTSTGTNYSVSGLTADTAYSFTVIAKDAAGNISASSNTANVTTTNVVQYTLTTNTVGQGTVSGGGTYNSGTSVSVTATAASGWEFGEWTGALSGNTNPGSITMDADKTVTATFTEVISVSTSTEKYRLTWREDPSTTMVIGWNQVRATNPVVHYGPTDFGLNYSSYPLSKTVDRTVSSKGMDNRYVRLTGLQPDTAYYFVIKDSEGVSERYWFKTAPNDPNTRLSIVAGGDSRNNRTPRQNANRLVAKIRPHAVLFGGDMTSSSSSSQWQNWFEDWQLTVGSDGRMIPVVAARGNHESSNDIRDLFDIPTAAGGEYYALSFGGNLMRTYTLNTEVTPAGTQGTWLANDLAANSANHTWAVAQYHRTTRPHEPGKSEQNDQYDAWSLPFYTHAVQLVMESDSHVVKRTWPIKPSTAAGSDEGFVRADTDPKRAVYVGEGCWGAPLRNASDTKNWTRAAGSFNQFKWLWIDQNKIELRTIKVDNAGNVGQVSDNNLFVLPSNIDVWNPTGGNVVIIDNPHTVAVTRINNTASVDDNSIVERKLSIHPNPIESGILHITYPNYAKAYKSQAIIRDMFGRIVDQIIFTSETTTHAIDKLNAGVYFIVIKTRKGEISKKFIKK